MERRRQVRLRLPSREGAVPIRAGGPGHRKPGADPRGRPLGQDRCSAQLWGLADRGRQIPCLRLLPGELATLRRGRRAVTLQPGTRLGTYEILSPLGAGGMGEVYRARDTKLDRDVAVKVLPADLANDPEALSRLEREAGERLGIVG